MNPPIRLTETSGSRCARPPWISLCAPIVLAIRDGQYRINLVNNDVKRRIEPIARLRQRNRDFCSDVARVRTEDQNAIAHQDRFLDVVRHHQHGLCRQPVSPQIEKIGSKRLRGQDIQRRKRLVHQEQDRLADDRPRKADPLAHTPGQLARVSRLETVETDQIDGRQRAPAHLIERQAERVEAQLDVLEDGEPRVQGEGLETRAMPSAGPASRLP